MEHQVAAGTEGRWAPLGPAPGSWRSSSGRRPSRRQVLRRRRLLASLSVLAAVAAVFAFASSPARPPRRRNRRRPLAVLATSPAIGATGVPPTGPLVVETSRPLPTSLPEPSISPAVAGHWGHCGQDEECFTPATPFPFGASVTVTVPLATDVRPDSQTQPPTHDRTAHDRAASVRPGQHRAKLAAAVITRSFTLRFQVATQSVGLAQVLLARLHYLPLRDPTDLQPVAGRRPAPGASPSPPPTPVDPDPASQLTWRYPSTPAAVQALWEPGVDSTMTQGAIVQFERVHGLESGSYPPYGTSLSAPLWQALLQAAVSGNEDPDPYAVAEVSESEPEHLTIWSNGAPVLDTLVNTGIPGGATPTGAYFVYLRYRSQTMRGTTVSGTPYVYPDVPDVNYFSGNFAIHGFERASYGFPQSQGCVEVPLAEAPVVFGDLHYGSLVLVA